MRPVRRGQRDRWVYSGVSWSDLDYPSDDLLPDMQDLLLQFRAAAGSAARYASPRSAWLTLDEVSTAFWSLLDQADRVGLVLVTEKAGPPVGAAGAGRRPPRPAVSTGRGARRDRRAAA